MKVWIMYDISNTKLRNKIAKYCKQIGLKRMQKSVFFGETRLSLLRRFQKDSETMLQTDSDSIIILPTTQKGMKRILSIGKLNVDKLIYRQLTQFL
ncbi:MAG: CRISPR-associated endonuclease Cas2 [Bacteroidota bacterium]